MITLNGEMEVNFDNEKIMNIFNNNLKDATVEIKKLLSKYAKNNHRYVSDTGKLKRNTKVKDNSKGDYLNFNLELYVDEKEVYYGRYIIKGHRSWSPDNFLEKAYNKNENKINEIIRRSVNKAIKEIQSLF
ncbi:MAG: hypothetical protein K9L56_15000 [Clostridiales bacterium]|nr:hypothetical protein [Clostridiales bacterium]